MAAAGTPGQEATINFDPVTSGVIVGSCLRNAADAEKAQAAGVAVVFSLQDETDLANQSIDTSLVASACQAIGMGHVRYPTSDADEQELVQRLPAAVASFAQQVAAAQGQGGSAYIHCNGGRGRAPTIVTAFLYWLGGQSLSEAAAIMTAGRKSQPKLPVIVQATADLLGEPAGEAREGLTEAERATIKARLDALA